MSQNLKINGTEFSSVEKLLIPTTGGSEAEFILSESASHFATGYVKNITAGQALSVSGITDERTGEAFDVKGVVAFIQPTSNTTVYPVNHAPNKPAVFCFVRDNSRGFGIAMACVSTSGSEVREVRLNTDIGGVSDTDNAEIIFTDNGFTFLADTGMYGLIAANQWRWVAWG